MLINEYAGQSPEGSSIPIYHFDLYRLGDPEELYDIGCDDFFYGSGICLIEWADLGGDLIPDHAIEVRFSHVGEMIRNLTLSGG